MKPPTHLRGWRIDHMRVPTPLFPVIALAAIVPIVLATDLTYRITAERVYVDIAAGVTHDVASMTAAQLAQWTTSPLTADEARLDEFTKATFGGRGEVIIVDRRSGRLFLGDNVT